MDKFCTDRLLKMKAILSCSDSPGVVLSPSSDTRPANRVSMLVVFAMLSLLVVVLVALGLTIALVVAEVVVTVVLGTDMLD